jgi:hypothetical protein
VVLEEIINKALLKLYLVIIQIQLFKSFLNAG